MPLTIGLCKCSYKANKKVFIMIVKSHSFPWPLMYSFSLTELELVGNLVLFWFVIVSICNMIIPVRLNNISFVIHAFSNWFNYTVGYGHFISVLSIINICTAFFKTRIFQLLQRLGCCSGHGTVVNSQH